MRTIDVQKKRDRTYEIVLKDSSGAAVNLTGATVKLSIRSEENEPTVIRTYSTTPGVGEGLITITDATGGKINVVFDDGDFSAISIPHGRASVTWKWDLLVITSAGTRLDTRDGTDYVQKFVLHTNITD
jgi:hypothetical protein